MFYKKFYCEIIWDCFENAALLFSPQILLWKFHRLILRSAGCRLIRPNVIKSLTWALLCWHTCSHALCVCHNFDCSFHLEANAGCQFGVGCQPERERERVASCFPGIYFNTPSIWGWKFIQNRSRDDDGVMRELFFASPATFHYSLVLPFVVFRPLLDARTEVQIIYSFWALSAKYDHEMLSTSLQLIKCWWNLRWVKFS